MLGDLHLVTGGDVIKQREDRRLDLRGGQDSGHRANRRSLEAVRLFPLVGKRLNVHARYSFAPEGVPIGALSPLRDPTESDHDK